MERHHRRMLWVLFVVHLLTGAGFSVVVPFLPLYVKQLGVSNPAYVVFWSGLVFSAPALTMMLAAPLWGLAADRYGRKLMLIRATLGGALVIGLMGVVHQVEWLVVLRGLQGMLGGYVTASTALVAATVPRTHSGESLGLLRTGSWVGAGLGPLAGGVLADIFGMRASFFVTAVLLAVAGLLVTIFVREEVYRGTRRPRSRVLATLRLLLAIPALRRLFTISFLDSLVRSMILPVLALFVVEIVGARRGASSITGLILGLKAISGAVFSLWVGKLGDRIGHERVVVVGAIALSVLYLPQPYVNAAWQLVVLQALVGIAAVGIGPAIAALFSLHLPEGHSGGTFGVEASLDALARVIGPLIGAGAAIVILLSGVFKLAAVMYLVLTLLTIRLARLAVSSEPARTSSSAPD